MQGNCRENDDRNHRSESTWATGLRCSAGNWRWPAPIRKNAALCCDGRRADANSATIRTQQQDIDEGRTNGLNAAMLDRLSLQGRLAGIARIRGRWRNCPIRVGETFDAAVRPTA
jgi:gamma-glutamyl phosphate reductase